MSDDAPDAPSKPERTSLLSRLAPKPSSPLPDGELRTRMRTLDPQERKWGFWAGALPILSATISLAVNSKVNRLKSLVHGQCTAPGHLVVKTHACVELVTLKASVPLVALQFVLGVVILVAVWRSLRVLTIVATVFAGLASGVLGILAVFYGFWLLLRSWRLQRYGVADGASVRKVVTERASEKREAKKSPARATATDEKRVTPSKRYTPKAKPRKR